MLVVQKKAVPLHPLISYREMTIATDWGMV